MLKELARQLPQLNTVYSVLLKNYEGSDRKIWRCGSETNYLQ